MRVMILHDLSPNRASLEASGTGFDKGAIV
jgi:hypothetical protein